jgi:hypothetical protein
MMMMMMMLLLLSSSSSSLSFPSILTVQKKSQIVLEKAGRKLVKSGTCHLVQQKKQKLLGMGGMRGYTRG